MDLKKLLKNLKDYPIINFMKIIGIGVDLVENSRIKRLIKNDNFIDRVFTKKEINNSKKILKKKFNLNASNFFLSISNAKKYSIAFVIFKN